MTTVPIQLHRAAVLPPEPQELTLGTQGTGRDMQQMLMLLSGNSGHRRNPAGSVERQAERVLGLL